MTQTAGKKMIDRLMNTIMDNLKLQSRPLFKGKKKIVWPDWEFNKKETEQDLKDFDKFSDWLYTLGLKCSVKGCGDEGCVIEAIKNSVRSLLASERERIIEWIVRQIGNPPECLDILIEGKTIEQSQQYIEGAEDMRKMIKKQIDKVYKKEIAPAKPKSKVGTAKKN